MDFSLDTHTFLWFYQLNPRLSSYARSLILDSNNTIHLSMASCWEMAIKCHLGKLDLQGEQLEIVLRRELALNKIQLMPISIQHVLHTMQLPHHHGDPFDRLLIAQSIHENMPLIIADSSFDQYQGLDRRW